MEVITPTVVHWVPGVELPEELKHGLQLRLGAALPGYLHHAVLVDLDDLPEGGFDDLAVVWLEVLGDVWSASPVSFLPYPDCSRKRKRGGW